MNNSLLKSLGALALCIITASLSVACDEIKDQVTMQIEDTLNGEESPLRELDLPNCSKVITCCDKLKERGYSDEVSSLCEEQFQPAVDLAIDSYQTARDALTDNAEEQEEALNELRSRTQLSFEPGCRCFLEETIGAINTDAVDLLPLDCEVEESSGALEEGAMCSDATSSLLSGATE